MFANHSFYQSTKFVAVAIFLLAAAPAYGWQDFPSFDEMMREADLPGSGRTSNQPVRQPESAWPSVAPTRKPSNQTDQVIPLNRGDRLRGDSPSNGSSWPAPPVDRSGRSTIGNDSLLGNGKPRTGNSSGFERFQPTTGQQPLGRQSVIQPPTGRNPLDTSLNGPVQFNPRGGDRTYGDSNSNDPSIRDLNKRDLNSGGTRQSGRGNGGFQNSGFENSGRSIIGQDPNGRNFGGRNSDLQDPFGNRRSQPLANESTDFLTLPPTGPSAAPMNSSEFIRPAGQSRPLSRPTSGYGLQEYGPPESRSQDFEPPPFGSPDFGQDFNAQSGRGLDAGFGSSLPRRNSVTGDLDDDTEPEADSSEFDWRTIRVSVGDIILPSNTVFQHTDSVLSIREETAYLDLIQDIESRKKALTLDPVLARMSANARLAVWEECFYEFKKARQLAFRNGKLRHESKSARVRNGLKDPFGGKVDEQSLTSRTNYEVLDDIRRYPDHFTGRPIVLYGLFRPESDRTMSRNDGALDPTISSVEENSPEPVINRSAIHGLVYDNENRLTKATVTTGSLTLATSGELLATVDTSGLTTPRRGVQDIRSAWRNLAPFPVLIKGWVVKKFKGDRPLIYCESMRLLSPEPHRSLVQTHTYDKQRVQAEEKWLYYETLQQMYETRSDMQQELGRQNLIERIDILQSEIIDKFKEEALALEAKHSKGKVTQAKYEKQLGSLNRQFQMRKLRHQKYRSETDKFPTYVDLFQNPEEWHGKIVTLRGHVRHSVTYAADSTMYDGRPLYELWLFTDDSQHTPAVILTPELPADFPMDAEIVNQVTVTGCFFKRYVYTGQAERRIAPLILAGRIQWSPTVSHVASLVKSGDLSSVTPLAIRAKVLESKQSGNTAMILISLVIIFGLMVLWGRAQREERDRLRLRDRIVDVKEIENGPPPEFASAADEYLNRIRVR